MHDFVLPPDSFYSRWTEFELFLWKHCDKVNKHKLSKREFTFVFNDHLTYRTAHELGLKTCLPYIFYSDICGCYYININYDFVCSKLYEHFVSYFSTPPL